MEALVYSLKSGFFECYVGRSGKLRTCNGSWTGWQVDGRYIAVVRLIEIRLNRFVRADEQNVY